MSREKWGIAFWLVGTLALGQESLAAVDSRQAIENHLKKFLSRTEIDFKATDADLEKQLIRKLLSSIKNPQWRSSFDLDAPPSPKQIKILREFLITEHPAIARRSVHEAHQRYVAATVQTLDSLSAAHTRGFPISSVRANQERFRSIFGGIAIASRLSPEHVRGYYEGEWQLRSIVSQFVAAMLAGDTHELRELNGALEAILKNFERTASLVGGTREEKREFWADYFDKQRYWGGIRPYFTKEANWAYAVAGATVVLYFVEGPAAAVHGRMLLQLVARGTFTLDAIRRSYDSISLHGVNAYTLGGAALHIAASAMLFLQPSLLRVGSASVSVPLGRIASFGSKIGSVFRAPDAVWKGGVKLLVLGEASFCAFAWSNAEKISGNTGIPAHEIRSQAKLGCLLSALGALQALRSRPSRLMELEKTSEPLENTVVPRARPRQSRAAASELIDPSDREIFQDQIEVNLGGGKVAQVMRLKNQGRPFQIRLLADLQRDISNPARAEVLVREMGMNRESLNLFERWLSSEKGRDAIKRLFHLQVPPFQITYRSALGTLSREYFFQVGRQERIRMAYSVWRKTGSVKDFREFVNVAGLNSATNVARAATAFLAVMLVQGPARDHFNSVTAKLQEPTKEALVKWGTAASSEVVAKMQKSISGVDPAAQASAISMAKALETVSGRELKLDEAKERYNQTLNALVRLRISVTTEFPEAHRFARDHVVWAQAYQADIIRSYQIGRNAWLEETRLLGAMAGNRSATKVEMENVRLHIRLARESMYLSAIRWKVYMLLFPAQSNMAFSPTQAKIFVGLLKELEGSPDFSQYLHLFAKDLVKGLELQKRTTDSIREEIRKLQ